jgi:hypothetical protein
MIVNLSHYAGFALLVRSVILNDAQCINPEILDVKPSGDGDDIPEIIWE